MDEFLRIMRYLWENFLGRDISGVEKKERKYGMTRTFTTFVLIGLFCEAI